MRKLLVLLTALLLGLALAMPAVAQQTQSPTQWGFYGSARMWTSYGSKDAKTPTGLYGAPGNARALTGAPTFDDADVAWQIQDNSRFGVNVAAGDVTGQVEMGMDPPSTNFEAVRLRILKGTWKFGAGSLLVGQDVTPLYFPVSDQCGVIGGDCGFQYWGWLYTGRQPQVRLSFGAFQFAALSPARAANGGLPAHSYTGPTGFTTVEYDTVFPEIEASYVFNFGPAALMIGGGYHIHKAVDASDNDQSINAYALTAGVKTAFGAFYVNGQLSYSQNPVDYGLSQDSLIGSARYVGGDIENVSSWRGVIVVGFKISDLMKLEGGFGAIQNKQDQAVGIESKETTLAYYLQLAYSPVKNVFLVPEVGYVDYGKYKVTNQPDNDLGTAWYLGLKWQINF
jgi:hypothetical protein